MSTPIFDWIVIAGIGGSIGTVSGLFGVGGGFLLVPALNILMQIPIQIAVGSGVCQVLGPATTSLLARDIQLADLRLPLIMLGGLVVGVPLGADALAIAEQGELPVSSETLVNGIYVVLMTLLGVFGLWETYRQKKGRPIRTGWLVKIRIPPFIAVQGLPTHRISLPVLVWFALAVGFLSGMLGMSGGLVLIPGLIYLWGQEVHRAQISTLIIVWLISAVATITHAWQGNVELGLVVALLFGGTVGAKLGTGLANRLGGRQLRQSFGWLLLVSATLIASRWFFQSSL